MSDSSILNSFPLDFQWKTQDPFLFCVHHEDHYPKGNENFGPAESLDGHQIGQDFSPTNKWRMYHGDTVPGFPAHPHRGFETVTIVRKGLVDHADSMGAAGRFGHGDVQWMTAGKGVQHSEMFPLFNRDQDNPFELFQIWLNLPRNKKMTEPHFKMLWSEDLTIVDEVDENGKKTKLSLVAGIYGEKKAPEPAPNSWAAEGENEVAIWNIKMEAGARWKIPSAAESVNRSLFFFKGGEIQIDDRSFSERTGLELSSSASVEIKNWDKESEFLLLQGKPLNEPVVQYGPFVMNTQEEIRETMMDYQRTQFGGWPWPKHDQVHDPEKGRFALHANGQEETK